MYVELTTFHRSNRFMIQVDSIYAVQEAFHEVPADQASAAGASYTAQVPCAVVYTQGALFEVQETYAEVRERILSALRQAQPTRA